MKNTITDIKRKNKRAKCIQNLPTLKPYTEHSLILLITLDYYMSCIYSDIDLTQCQFFIFMNLLQMKIQKQMLSFDLYNLYTYTICIVSNADIKCLHIKQIIVWLYSFKTMRVSIRAGTGSLSDT